MRDTSPGRASCQPPQPHGQGEATCEDDDQQDTPHGRFTLGLGGFKLCHHAEV